MQILQGLFFSLGGGKKNAKSFHFLREKEKIHLLPYFDNEFLEVPRTRQDSYPKKIILLSNLYPSWAHASCGRSQV
jgi:hypothetical protein